MEDDFFGSAPLVDEEEVAAIEAERQQRQRQKEARVRTGIDERLADCVQDGTVDNGSGDGAVTGAATPTTTTTTTTAGGDAIEQLTLLQREERWGFSLSELHAATKVVSVLFNNPQLYVGDPYLAESRLYTMISRDRKTKRENKEAFKKIQNEEKNRRDRAKRELDVATIKKTLMKRERDTALQALMLPSSKEDDEAGDHGPPKLLAAGPAAAGRSDSATPAATPTDTAVVDALPPHALTDLTTAFKICKFIECEHHSAQRDARPVHWHRVGIATAKFYRIYPHEFGTSMPPPLFAEELLDRKIVDLLGSSGASSASTATSCAVGAEPLSLRALLRTAACSGETEARLTIGDMWRLRIHERFRQQVQPGNDKEPTSASAAVEEDAELAGAVGPASFAHLPWSIAKLAALRAAYVHEGPAAPLLQDAFRSAISWSSSLAPATAHSSSSSGSSEVSTVPTVEALSLELVAEAALLLARIRDALAPITKPSGDGEVADGASLLEQLNDKYAELVSCSLLRDCSDKAVLAAARRSLRIVDVPSLVEHQLRISALADLLILCALPSHSCTLSTATSAEDLVRLREGRPESNPLFHASGSGGGAEPDSAEREPEHSSEAAVSFDLFTEDDVFRAKVFGLLNRGGAARAGAAAGDDAATATTAAAVVPRAGEDYGGSTGAAAEFTMNRLQKCHTCKGKYRELHGFYYSLCPPCGEYNYDKRMLTRDLRGKVVILTGCRIKIGYAMGLSLLRCGATLIGTTRFSHDAVARFMQEPDFDAWKDRLHLYSLDLRDLWMVTQFCGFVAQHFPKLFAIINNAAQTIARTPEYTAELRRQEAAPPPPLIQALRSQGNGKSEEWWNFFLHNSSVTIGESLKLEHHPSEHPQPFVHGQHCIAPTPTAASPALAAPGSAGAPALPSNRSERSDAAARPPSTELRVGESRVVSTLRPASEGFIYDRYDTQAEESDQRSTNSWTMNLAEVSGSEAAEVMAINALSPFVLNSRLKPQLMNRSGDRTPNERRFIINVSAMEGQFYRFKQTTHPHTNMAKSALNMMTRTSAADYARSGIFMNSVDTGWITDESPMEKKQRRSEEFMLCPLDEVDAAARCLDLIYTDSPANGHFYKDFHTIAW